MKTQLSVLLIIALIISSCCREDSIETARYELSSDELELIPYQKGQQISFIHSNGYSFNFMVVEDKLEWKEYHEFCEWNCCGQDYFSYQVKNTKLESIYPKINIDLSIGGTRFGDYYPMFLSLDINNRHFVSIQYDSTSNFICDTITKTICYDSIMIDSKIYFNVFEKYFDSHYFIQDSSILVPLAILYNKLGLIQIKMSNNETYSLNN